MLLLASTATNIAFACGAAIVSFFLIRRSRRYLMRSATESSPAFTADSQVAHRPVTVTSAEVTRGQVQLHETARELMGQLDSKMSALQALIRLADEAATELNNAADRAERLGLAARRDTLEELANLPTPDKQETSRLLEDLSAESGSRKRIDP